MRILVTGAAGFLATECLRQLRPNGHAVLTTDRRGDVDFIGDLADEAFCAQLPDVDTVVHAAAVQYLSPDLPMFGRKDYFQRNNIVATRNLARRYAEGCTHFVNIGTSMMYEQSGRPVYDTRSPMRGQGVYSQSKIVAQRFVDDLPIPSACVIPCIIAGDGRGGLFKSLVDSMTRFRTTIYPGFGRHKVHVVHVSDAASLVTKVIETRSTGRFNAASAEPLSIEDWVKEIAAELGLDGIRHVPVPLRPVEVASAALGYRLLAREQLLMLSLPHVLSLDEGLSIGWAPRYTNARVIRETARALAGDTTAS